MDENTKPLVDSIKACESQIETALVDLEMQEKPEPALEVYLAVKSKLDALEPQAEHPEYPAHQSVLAYCLMRTANILRQLDRGTEAAKLTELEIAAARHSGDQVTLGRSLMSHGMTTILAGEIESGVTMIDEALTCFEYGESYDHIQGRGWLWILWADLSNAGLLKAEPEDVKHAANQAIALLLPIENWPGVARAYAARAAAYAALGDPDAADADREKQALYAQMPQENGLEN